MNIITLLKLVEERPLMFLNKKTIFELDTFLRGFAFATQTQNDIKGFIEDEFTIFTRLWLKKKYKKEIYDWKRYYKKFSKDADEIFTLFFKDWNEYVNEISFPPIT